MIMNLPVGFGADTTMNEPPNQPATDGSKLVQIHEGKASKV